MSGVALCSGGISPEICSYVTHRVLRAPQAVKSAFKCPPEELRTLLHGTLNSLYIANQEATSQLQLEYLAGATEQLQRMLSLLSTTAATGAPAKPLGLESAQAQVALVVDDVKTNRVVLKRMLENRGWHVVEAEDGCHVLELFEDPSFVCDVVFMDVQMPRLDGLECTQMLRDDFGIKVPVIGITADANADITQEALDAGMDALYFKPMNLDNLLEVVMATGSGNYG